MTHLSDGELIRFVDGEHTHSEAALWRAHVDSCSRCSLEADTIRDQSRLVSRWLARADFEDGGVPTGGAEGREADRPGRRDWLVPALKAAAVVLLLVSPLAALPGVRAWVARQVGLTEAPTPTVLEVPGALVRFVPDPGVFTLELEGVGPAVVTLERAPEGSGEAVLDLSGPAEPVVSSRSVLLVLSGETRVRLALPAAVTQVRVMRAAEETVVPAAELDGGRVVELPGG